MFIFDNFLVLGVRSSEFGGATLGVPHESEKPYIAVNLDGKESDHVATEENILSMTENFVQ